MKFKQYENGSCDIEFSWKERIILFRKGRLHLSDENLRHFGNNLVRIVTDWQIKFNQDIANKQTFTDTKIEGK
jgi:aromatic ring-opening dioxygenase LigB subunit